MADRIFVNRLHREFVYNGLLLQDLTVPSLYISHTLRPKIRMEL